MSEGRRVAIIGAELDLGAGRRGVDMGPSAIRYAGLGERLRSLGIAAQDWGNVYTEIRETTDVGDSSARFLTQIRETCERIAEQVRNAAENGFTPLVLGGDHSIALGTIGGLASLHGPGAVLWFDAHGDLNTPSTTPSGNVHGMPLAAALGLAGAGFESNSWPLPALDPNRVVLIGARSIDPGEKEAIKELGVAVYTMSDIDRRGVEPVLREALERVDGAPFVHVSVDLDLVDPDVAPGSARLRAAVLVPRGAPGDGARGGERPPDVPRARRGEPDPRPRERDGRAGGRAGRERAGCPDPLTHDVIVLLAVLGVAGQVLVGVFAGLGVLWLIGVRGPLVAVRDAIWGYELWLAFLVSAVATAGSLFFSEVAHFFPCELCWFQRIFMYPLAIVTLLAALANDYRVARYLLPLPYSARLLRLPPARRERASSSRPRRASLSAPGGCATKWIDEFGYVTIPTLALTGFALELRLPPVRGPRERQRRKSPGLNAVAMLPR